jgi:quinol monooxygenase YgiN
MSESMSGGGKVAVFARIAAQPGKRDEMVKAMEALIENAKTEAGTLTYILHVDDKEPDAVFFYELYSDEDALTAHGTSDRFKEIGKSLRDLAGGRPELQILKPLIGKGL